MFEKQPEIASVVITYFPEISLLHSVLNSLASCSKIVFLYDNGSGNIEQIHKCSLLYKNILIFENKENKGISYNLNKALREAKAYSCDWLLTMDQDSIISNEGILLFKKAILTSKKDVASLTPWIYYRNFSSSEKKPKEGVSSVSSCITSGNLIYVKAALDIGGFDERYFIDFVDIEFCKRLTEHNLKILRINNIVLNHDLGGARQFRLLGHIFFVYRKKAIRLYYIFRNQLYFIRQHYSGTKKHILILLSSINRALYFLDYPISQWGKLRKIIKAAKKDSKSEKTMGRCQNPIITEGKMEIIHD